MQTGLSRNSKRAVPRPKAVVHAPQNGRPKHSLGIIESHGGRLWAASNQPRGAVFLFVLPAENDEPHNVGAPFKLES